MLCKVIVCAVLLVSVLRVSADELALAAERGAAELGPDCRVGAVFRSLLVPGYGQLARGERVKGALVLGAE
ncbi:MAG TPA: hypothetical protein VF400_01480, partial [Anaeromyxobacteraceae bacterium]